MLELALGLTTNEQVQVTLNGGVASHDFLLSALGISKDEVETFFDDPSLYGLRLYQALFPAGSQAEAGLKQLGLGERLALRLQDEQLNTLPWEYLYNGKYYLATEYALLRVVSPAGALPPAGPAQRLRLLFVPADPLLHRNQPAPYRLGVDAEWDELEAILQKADPAVDLVKTMPPTVQKLQDELPGMKGGIVHFTGHGSQQDDMAYLLFERLNGSSDPVETGRMASLLRGRTSLLVLSACQSAMPGEGTEANLAAQLCRQGAPWVLGMQLSVSDEAARHFTSTFYRFLFAGEDLCEALRQARLDVLADSALQMGIPVLYAADPARQGCLCPAGRGLQVAALPQPQLAGLPVLETRFFGRQHQLVELGTHLTRERLRQGQDYPPLAVTLHGPGGIGKTALLVQAAARFAWAFEGVLGLPLEPLEVSGVLLRLENYLGLADGGLLPLPQRYERLLEALRGRRLLLALDNFESVLHAAQGQGEEQPPDTQAAELYAFLGQLPGRGVTLLVSSREFSGLPGEAQVEVPGLKELPGAQLFRSLIIRRSHLLSEAGCLELSRAAGGHPLAIRLLGGLFESGEGDTLAEFVGQLDAFLLKAAKKVRLGGRHDTLESCFDFSLGFVARSSPELERALARLSEFRGAFLGFMAVWALFPIADDTPDEERKAWTQQTQTTLHRLWELGLLERQLLPVGEEETLIFYHLHPALAPFAAQRLNPAEQALAREGYFAAMYRLGGMADEQYRQGGLLIPLLQRALPDLTRAAQLRDDREGSLLRFRVARLLVNFGELDAALQLYEESLAITEALGNKQGKGATLHAMAGIYVTRGELDAALQLYEESLAIKEALGDKRGAAVTKGEMAKIYLLRGDVDTALRMQEEKLEVVKALDDQREQGVALHQIAGIYVTRGELDAALQLYEESLAIKEALGDKKGKGDTLHAMAYIYRVRGELDAALQLYEESLAMAEALGDKQGKAATLAMMGQLLIGNKQYREGVAALLTALQILGQVGARPDAQQVAEILVGVRQQLGAAQFDALFNEITGQAVPEWLRDAPPEEQDEGLSVEEWVRRSVRAAKGHLPEAKDWFELAGKVAADRNVPDELRTLARVLQSVLAGNLQPDLSALPAALAALVQQALEEDGA